ncbi:unnamed protein product [Clonostachys rosea]|uniref:Extracellular membrane protein CFEM domain-containing protein n=1 Tax=Bionectria ochroleuca TaxID=29856 RepID=A0ABY6UGK0_BIOOC|nr:unnamed protein product [Clonostachys rosea]
MRFTRQHTALVWASTLLVRQATAAYWINQLANYSSLPVCAEGPISTIVRGMVKGCGDGGRGTSYSCFCTKSSSTFKGLIASSVAEECSGTGTAVASATALFEEYCSLGIKQASATTTGSDTKTSTNDGSSSKTDNVATSTSASQAESNSSVSITATASVTTNSSNDNGITSTTASSTSDSTASTTETATSDASASSSSSVSLGTGAKVAIGVCIPLVVIAIAAAIFMFFRRRRETKPNELYGGVRLESREEVQVYHKSTSEPGSIVHSTYELQSASTPQFQPPQEPRSVYEKPELDGTPAAVRPLTRKYELE